MCTILSVSAFPSLKAARKAMIGRAVWFECNHTDVTLHVTRVSAVQREVQKKGKRPSMEELTPNIGGLILEGRTGSYQLPPDIAVRILHSE